MLQYNKNTIVANVLKQDSPESWYLAQAVACLFDAERKTIIIANN